MFDTRLKELRTGAGLTQAQLAKQLGVTQSTIGNWESGCRVPRHRNCAQSGCVFRCFHRLPAGGGFPCLLWAGWGIHARHLLPSGPGRQGPGFDPTRCGPSAGHRREIKDKEKKFKERNERP